MTIPSFDRRRAAILGFAGSLAAAGLSWLSPHAALAEDAPAASPWSSQKYGPMRLVAGLATLPRSSQPRLYAGVQIKLDPGWKTYWRQPGDSGVPPQFDWSGSTNLAQARPLYPAPIRLHDGGLTMLGYKGEVLIPVEVTPSDASKPIELKLAAEYGVCKDICIPAEAKLSLILPPQPAPGESALIGRALERVPQPTAAGLPSVRLLKQDLSGPAPRLLLDASFPRGSDGADAFIEIEGGELAPLPAIAERKGNDVRFEARFASAEEAKRFAGKAVVVTLISQAAQSEVRAKVE